METLDRTTGCRAGLWSTNLAGNFSGKILAHLKWSGTEYDMGIRECKTGEWLNPTTYLSENCFFKTRSGVLPSRKQPDSHAWCFWQNLWQDCISFAASSKFDFESKSLVKSVGVTLLGPFALARAMASGVILPFFGKASLDLKIQICKPHMLPFANSKKRLNPKHKFYLRWKFNYFLE